MEETIIKKSITMREMCETICRSEMFGSKDEGGLTAKEIFNYSPTGELSEIFVWYAIACDILKEENIFETEWIKKQKYGSNK